MDSSSTHHFLNLISSPPPPSSAADLDRKQRITPSNSGVLVALADFDRNSRMGSIVTRESSTAMGRRMSSSIQADCCRKLEQSAPINVPRAMREQRNQGENIDDAEEEEVLPPHEMVGRGSGVSPNTTFSVLEGIGRTLKGRDLRRVRNAVWHGTTGFLD